VNHTPGASLKEDLGHLGAGLASVQQPAGTKRHHCSRCRALAAGSLVASPLRTSSDSVGSRADAQRLPMHERRDRPSPHRQRRFRKRPAAAARERRRRRPLSSAGRRRAHDRVVDQAQVRVQPMLPRLAATIAERLCIATRAGVPTGPDDVIALDERQQRRAAARWLLLRLRLQARPRRWGRCPTVPEERHLSARQVRARSREGLCGRTPRTRLRKATRGSSVQRGPVPCTRNLSRARRALLGAVCGPGPLWTDPQEIATRPGEPPISTVGPLAFNARAGTFQSARFAGTYGRGGFRTCDLSRVKRALSH
jgi:hypothetical protein